MIWITELVLPILQVVATEIRELATIEKGKIEPRQISDWDNELLYIPPLPPTNLRGCHLIRIQYDVFVGIQLYYFRFLHMLATPKQMRLLNEQYILNFSISIYLPFSASIILSMTDPIVVFVPSQFVVILKGLQKDIRLQLPILMATYPLRNPDGTLKRGRNPAHFPSVLPIFRPASEVKY